MEHPQEKVQQWTGEVNKEVTSSKIYANVACYTDSDL